MYEIECLTNEDMVNQVQNDECSPFWGECYPVGCEPGSCAPA